MGGRRDALTVRPGEGIHIDSALAAGSSGLRAGATFEPGRTSPVAVTIRGLSSWRKLRWQNGQSRSYAACHSSEWQGNSLSQAGHCT
jgi:hypothetical protein